MGELTRLEDLTVTYDQDVKFDGENYRQYLEALSDLNSKGLIVPRQQRALTVGGETLVKDRLAGILYKNDMAHLVGVLYRVRLLQPDVVEADAALYELSDLLWQLSDDGGRSTLRHAAAEVSLSVYQLMLLGAIDTLNRGIKEGYAEMVPSNLFREGVHLKFTDKYLEFFERLEQREVS